MDSITKRLKKAILNNGTPGDVYDRQGIKNLIEENSNLKFGVDYQESHLAGTIAALIKKGEMKSPERGKYTVWPRQINLLELASPFELEFSMGDPVTYSYKDLNDYETIKKNIEKSIRGQVSYLEKVNLTIPIGAVDKEYLDSVVKIKELLDYLDKFQLS